MFSPRLIPSISYIDMATEIRLPPHMSDSVTTVSNQSWFSRIGSAFAGVIIGVILFLVSFPVLIFNEGNSIAEAKTLQTGEKLVVSVPASPVDPANVGKLVHVTGTTTISGPVEDPLFGISAEAIKLARNVEMYQWTESEKSETQKKLGGGEETVTTYTYDKKWSSTLADSSQFHSPDGHANPPEMPIESGTFVAADVMVGDFVLPEALVDRIDNFKPLPVGSDDTKNLSAELEDLTKVTGGKFYIGQDPKQPAVGDMRVEFEVADPGPISIIAQQNEDTFEPYSVKGLHDIYLLETSIVSAPAMFETAKQGNIFFTWLLRLVGFLMMLFGLLLIVKPLSVLADVLPFLGSLVGMGTGLMSLLVALPLTLVTIALAWLFFRPLIGLPLLVLAVVSIVLGVRALRRKSAAKAAIAPAA